MATVTVALVDEFLKTQFYPGDRLQDLSLKAAVSPLYRLINKNPGLGGEQLKVPIKYGGSPSGSADFATAQSQSGAPPADAFYFLCKARGSSGHMATDYSCVTLDGILFRVGVSDEHAFYSQIDSNVKEQWEKQSKRRAMQLYRSYHGYFGSIHATCTIASTALLWGYRGEARMADKGDQIQIAEDTTHTLRAATALTISAMGRQTNPAGSTVSANVDLGGGAAVAVGDRILFKGDLGMTMYGLEDQFPSGTPAALYGVTRTTDRTRLAGWPVDCSAKDVLTALIDGIHLLGEEGAVELTGFLPPETYKTAVELIRASSFYSLKEVTKQAIRADGNKSGTVSVSGFSIDGPYGPVEIYSDPFCPPQTGWLLEMDRLTLYTAGEDPGVLKEDGLTLLRAATADVYEIRVGGYPGLICDGPGHCAQLYNLAP